MEKRWSKSYSPLYDVECYFFLRILSLILILFGHWKLPVLPEVKYDVILRIEQAMGHRLLFRAVLALLGHKIERLEEENIEIT